MCFVEERFTAESFLLLDKSAYKDLGIGIGGQLLLDKLIEEVCTVGSLLIQ